MKNKIKEIGRERFQISREHRVEKTQERQEMRPRLKVCGERAKINSLYIRTDPLRKLGP